MTFLLNILERVYNISVARHPRKGYVVTIERNLFGRKFTTEFSAKEWEQSGLSLFRYIKSKYI